MNVVVVKCWFNANSLAVFNPTVWVFKSASKVFFFFFQVTEAKWQFVLTSRCPISLVIRPVWTQTSVFMAHSYLCKPSRNKLISRQDNQRGWCHHERWSLFMSVRLSSLIYPINSSSVPSERCCFTHLLLLFPRFMAYRHPLTWPSRTMRNSQWNSLPHYWVLWNFSSCHGTPESLEHLTVDSNSPAGLLITGCVGRLCVFHSPTCSPPFT